MGLAWESFITVILVAWAITTAQLFRKEVSDQRGNSEEKR